VIEQLFGEEINSATIQDLRNSLLLRIKKVGRKQAEAFFRHRLEDSDTQATDNKNSFTTIIAIIKYRPISSILM
jgi:hypothetical protein